MDDPRTFWLVVTNIILGVMVAALVLAIAFVEAIDIFHRLRARRSAWRELDRDMERYFGHPHTRR